MSYSMCTQCGGIVELPATVCGPCTQAIRAEITRRSTCPACLDGRHGECEDPCKCPCPAPGTEG